MDSIFPLYESTQPIYLKDDTSCVAMPLAVVERIAATEKARKLYNLYTGQEAWFPNSAFSFHWHVMPGDDDFQVFLNVSRYWVTQKCLFFTGKQ